MKDSKFVFESVDLLYYSLHKTTLRRGKSYIKSSKWLRNKGATINLQNHDDDNCFQYAVTAALHHQNIENYPERISNLKPFIDQYKWKGTEFPSHSKDSKKFEQNNKAIALNILFLSYNTKETRLPYKLKYNHKRDNQVILLMITDDGIKWHYLVAKRISALFREITSNNHRDFYSLNCLHSYRTKEKLEKHKNVCNNHDCCYVKMPNEYKKILKYKPGEKSLKVPFIIYSDLECLLEKMDSCQNDPEKPCTENKTEHSLQVTH